MIKNDKSDKTVFHIKIIYYTHYLRVVKDRIKGLYNIKMSVI